MNELDFNRLDKHGNLKPTVWFWLMVAFMSRSWLVLLMAGVSRSHGSHMLNLLYPHQVALYTGLVVGLPGLLLAWLAGARHYNKSWINTLWRSGQWILFAALSVDFVLQILALEAYHWTFEWPHALALVATFWFFIYLLRSRTLRRVFADTGSDPGK
ncbi:DUF2919 domain-containing protein [Parasalinivibrio latis]|uniref:DUF2919 domain-containing protein n=1 Tax=Parasalinivibrio latis TaxID=2952610 RepID=UPI003DA2C42B